MEILIFMLEILVWISSSEGVLASDSLMQARD
nr:MAG TPA: hypothetical protein [Caudoviricetes sp.]